MAKLWIDDDGTQLWFDGDRLHRLDGPAEICPDGSEAWYRDDLLHRDDGPAATWGDGSQGWYRDGYPHRLDGPALIWANNGPGPREQWFIEGQEMTRDEFLERVQTA